MIDEYDKPILDHINEIGLAESNRNVLRGFYGILKSMDPYLQFTMLTGVSKFAKTSIFSGLNNLVDITLMESYSGICGIGAGDLASHFSDSIDLLAKKDSLRHVGNLYEEILAWYDGYSWDGETRVINPFSLLNFLHRGYFSSFWYSSGAPKFLIDIIKENPELFLELKNLQISEADLDSFDLGKLDLVLLLFQIGYLTVSQVRYERGEPYFHLKIPNREVGESFHMNIIAELAGREAHSARQSKA
ncbi:MAG: AAA family ATPase [Eubacteriaceae bacterium]|nr:AAA family ATPase [Eubacteriaceae bacterium]